MNYTILIGFRGISDAGVIGGGRPLSTPLPWAHVYRELRLSISMAALAQAREAACCLELFAESAPESKPLKCGFCLFGFCVLEGRGPRGEYFSMAAC